MKDDFSFVDQTRRDLLAKMGTGLVAITVNSALGQVSPERARARGEVLRKLSEAEGRTFEALGDTLLPGAAKAGIAHFVDDQLGRDHPLLLLGVSRLPRVFSRLLPAGIRCA